MSCAVALSGSPIFSPSRETLYRRIASSSSETLIGSPSSSSSSSAASLLSPSSSCRLRLQKQVGGVRFSKKEVSVVNSASSSILKRKRPCKIDIPVSELSFVGTAERAPVGPKEVELESEHYSVFCKRGRREVMEDRYSAVVGIRGDPKQAFFGVFDGHGGTRAAEFAAQNIDTNVMEEVIRRGENEIVEAVKSGYLTTDLEYLKEGSGGGACCVTALIRNGDLVVSNIGDCRAVMSRGGVAEALTDDHRPSREDEKHRIQGLGGYVDNCHGMWRLQGSLAVSRGIGDAHLKQWVIADPETKVLSIDPGCEFLILASDGLWEKVSNQEAVNLARPFCAATTEPIPLAACKKLVELSVKRGSTDDTSVMIIQLGHFI